MHKIKVSEKFYSLQGEGRCLAGPSGVDQDARSGSHSKQDCLVGIS